MEERRLGTFTLGIVLLVSGILFLVHTFYHELKYYFVFRMWPVIFIILGGEILWYTFRQKNIKFKYDFAAIFIMIILVLFAMFMAGADWMYEHLPPEHYWIKF